VHDLDFDYHFQRIALPSPGNQVQLQYVVSRLMSTPLNLNRPLWQFTLVDNYEGGSAIVARVHHCIADGIALIQVLLSCTDREPDAPWPTREPGESGGRRLGGRGLGTWPRRVWAPVGSAYRTTSRTAGTLWHEGLETLAHPSHFLDLAKLGTSATTAFARLVMRWPDPKTLFKGPLGEEKVAAWSEPIPLREVKEIGQGLGATVNDVLISAVSGALRCYAQGRGEDVDGLSIRGVIPVNLRAPGHELELGNKFGLVFLSLPIGLSDPLERLLSVKHCMDAIKNTPEAAVAFGILNTIGLTPSEIEDLVVTIFGTKGTAVMTNVPGPSEPIYLAGAKLSTVMAWVPQSGSLGMGISIISYNGQVWLGVATDKGLVPDPETIVSLYRDEFDNLLALVRSRMAARRPSVKPMLATLDATLARLDALLEAQPPAEQPPASPAAVPAAGPAPCQALTRAGLPCKNPALPGSRVCRVHREAGAAQGPS
jgi:WS/DGAT/MGAT family acyltransferase